MPGLLGKVASTGVKDVEINVAQLLDGTPQRAASSVNELVKRNAELIARSRKALQTPIKVDYKDVTFSELLKELQKKAPGLSFHIRDLPSKLIPRKTGEGTTSAEAR